MARKDKKQLSYGQMPLPQPTRSYKSAKVDWSGLDKRDNADTGVLSAECNISTAAAPSLTPSPVWYDELQIMDYDDHTASYYEHSYVQPLGIFTFNNNLVIVYRTGAEVRVDYYEQHKTGGVGTSGASGRLDRRYTGIAKVYDSVNQAAELDAVPRSMVMFRVYDSDPNAKMGRYIDRLLLFPEKVSMYADICTVTKKPSTDTDASSINYGKPLDGLSDTVMYYYNSSDSDKGYYVYDSTAHDFVRNGGILNEDYLWGNDERLGQGTAFFNMDSLELDIKQNYNDGFCITADGSFESGFKRTAYTHYNDGYKGIPGGTHTTEEGITEVLYRRVNDAPPYEYEPTLHITGTVNIPKNSGYYVTVDSPLYPKVETALYKRTADSVKGFYTYTLCSGLNYGSDVSGFYELDNSDAASLIEVKKGKEYRTKAYYKRKGNIIDGFRYVPVAGLEDGKNVSRYYELNNEAQTPITGENGELSPGEYEPGVTPDIDAFAPPKDADKSKMYINIYTNMCYEYSEGINAVSGWNICSPPSFPDISYAAVHMSRLFGVSGDMVYVSGQGNYSDWTLDSIYSTNENNAWYAAAGANNKATNDFTAITVYDGHAVCFKPDYQQEIYNTSNPFRIVDIGPVGAIDNRSVAEVNNRLFFVSKDNVYMYSGAASCAIGQPLNIARFRAAVAGGDDRFYYLYCEDEKHKKHMFAYDTHCGAWSEMDIDVDVTGIVSNSTGVFLLTGSDKDTQEHTVNHKTGCIYKIKTDRYTGQKWSFETDLSTAYYTTSTSGRSNTYRSIDIKHIHKIQLLAEIDEGAALRIYALYDGEKYTPGSTPCVYDSAKRRDRNGLLAIRFLLRKTAHFGYKLHFEGEGYVRLHTLELSVRSGGELFTQGGDFLEGN